MIKKGRRKNGGIEGLTKGMAVDLAKFNISLEILSGDEIEIFTKIKKKNDITVYWSKVYEPAVITNGKKIRDLFIKNKIDYKYFKGNILIEFQDVTKDDGTPFKVFTPFWKKTEQRYISKKCLQK